MGRDDPMTVVNRTDGPVEVTLIGEEAVAADYPELPMRLDPGAGQSLGGPFKVFIDDCLRGSLVATRDGQTVATKDRPCAGSRWEIVEAALPN